MSADAKPILSVVIPTLGRPILVQTLESLTRARGFGDIEVVVAGAIPDATVLGRLNELIAKHPQIRHLSVSFTTGDSSRKKNAGFEASRADIVAFLDDDVVVRAEWPEMIREPFADESVAMVSGPSMVPPDVSLVARLAGVALASKAAGYVSERYLKGKPVPRPAAWSRLIGCNMAFRRNVLADLGGFPADFWPAEEMITSFRATQKGYKLIFHPDAYVYHYPRHSIRGFWKQMHGYGATRIRLIRAGTEMEPTTLVPGIWVLSLLVLGVAAIFNAWALWLLAADLALYALADAWITWSKFVETRRAVDLLIFFVIPVMHLSYGIAEWTELLRPNKDLSEKHA